MSNEDRSSDSHQNERQFAGNNKRSFARKKIECPLSAKGVSPIDYKDPDALLKFVSEGGRLLPSRITNVCAKKQRELKVAVKRARHLALLPFVLKTR
jgi:small subunit ribosomal protein S18